MNSNNAVEYVERDKEGLTSASPPKAVDKAAPQTHDKLTVTQNLIHFSLLIVSVAVGTAAFYFSSPFVHEFIESRTINSTSGTLSPQPIGSPQGFGVLICITMAFVTGGTVYIAFAAMYKKCFGIQLAI